MSSFDFSQFFITFLFYILWIVLVILIWNYVWLVPFPFTLPDFNPDSDEQLHITNAYSALRYLYYVLLKRFNPQFWLRHCGFDALAYIVFLRKIFSLVCLYFLTSFIFGMPYAISDPETELWNAFNLHDNIYKIYLQMFFLILYSVMFYTMIYDAKWVLLQSYQNFRKNDQKFYDLQLNTLRLKGLNFNYETMDFRQKLREILPKSCSDSLIQCVMIPESFNLLDLFSKKKELTFIKDIQKDGVNSCFCCSPYKELESKISIINTNIDKLTSKGFKFSGIAFICVDSGSSFQKIIQHFSFFHIGFWRGTCRRFRKTHIQNSHEDSLLSNPDDHSILASSAPSADDVSWRNLNKDSNISWVNRLALNILAIVLMVFFTTPASLITVFGLYDIIQRIMDSNPPEPGTFSNIIEKNLSPMLIILVNQLLLYVIDTLAYRKRQIKMSSTQLTIFHLCFVYMLINIFIIPALSMTTVESIFSFLSTNSVEKVKTLLKTFYLKDTGSLFIILLIQAGTFSFTFYLLRLSDLFLNFFDRKLISEKRQRRFKLKNWQREETDNFQYGYFYANMVIYLIVVLVFSTTVPIISLSGIFLFFLKLICDAFELISAHRKEIESGGKIIEKVLLYCCFGGLFFQILMLAYYSVNKLRYNVFVMAALIVGSGLITLKIHGMGKYDEIRQEGSNEIDIETLRRWEKAYRHPLLYSN